MTCRRPSRRPVRVTTRAAPGRVWTVLLCVAGAVLAQTSGTLVAFLGIFGYGLFAATTLPALAIGLNWEGATREGAIASIATGSCLPSASRWLARRSSLCRRG